MTFLASVPLGCDSKSKKSSSSEDDDDGDKKKKKKDKDKDKDDAKGDASGEASGKAAAKPVGVEVPGIAGFVVPIGGKYEHQKIELGEKVLEFENYTYPLKDFDRPGLKKTFKEGLTNAGWIVTQDPGKDTNFTVTKGTTSVEVMFGEAGTDETKINVMPPKTVAGVPPVPPPGDATPAGVVVFAGSYSSIWGPVTLEQSKATPNKVTGRYSKGTVSCTATDKKLDCSWAERGSSGRAVFTKDDKGDLPGTWGSGGSSAGGGAWNLKLTKAGELI